MTPLSRSHIFVTLTVLTILATATGIAQFAHFVTAQRDKLMDGDQELRFISFNIPNIHYVEDNHEFTTGNPWRVADEYEIRDALTAIRQLGGKVTRTYVPSVRKEGDDASIVRHVNGPGVFDEEAFKAYDKMLQIANEVGIRVIIPLVDNWWWWGGPKEYAAFRGKRAEEFWTDSLLISDFKQTITFMINRVNTYTGVRFRDDKAILGWETGNELDCPFSWTREIAATIKSLDSNHLVIEGTRSNEVSDSALAEPNIDVLTTHHYSPLSVSLSRIMKGREKTRNLKPYFIGELGFVPLAGMRQILDTVISSGVSGIMIWSMRGHNRDGGFYYHANSYRWPGFPSGDSWLEIPILQLFREKAFQINGLPPDSLPPPQPPRLLPIVSAAHISWQGSTGASSYLIERKMDGDIFWEAIARVTDADVAYRPLYNDTSAVPGKSYQYRILARNASGYSEPCDPSVPVIVGDHVFADELENGNRFVEKSANLLFVPPRDVAKAKEDRSRVTGQPGDFFGYRMDGDIESVMIDGFLTGKEPGRDLQLLAGDSTGAYFSLSCSKEIFPPLKNEYGAYIAVRYIARDVPHGDHYLRIILGDETQVARIEVTHK